MFNVRPTLSPISEAKRHAMKVKLDGLAKPTGGLGRLETLMITLAGIQQTTKPRTAKRCVMVFAGDHGVERAGVSATPRKVTWEQSINTLEGHTTVASLAIANHCDVKVIDVGVDHDLSGTGVIDKKVNWGTKNLAEEPAMTRDEAIQCLQAGYDVALDTINEGNDLLLIGELVLATQRQHLPLSAFYWVFQLLTLLVVVRSFPLNEWRTKLRWLKKPSLIGSLILMIQLTF